MPWAASLEEHHLQLVLEQGRTGGHHQTPPVVASLRDDDRAGAEALISDRHAVGWEVVSEELLQQLGDIGQLAELALETHIYLRHHVGIQADAGHDEKAAIIHLSQGDGPNLTSNDAVDAALDVIAQTYFCGQNVGGT